MHATDFYLDQVRDHRNLHGDGIPRIACRTAGPPRGEFRRNPPVLGKPAQELAPGELPGSGAQTGAHHAGAVVRRPGGSPLEDAVRIDDLYELACWLARARLYIGNDSGITHLAAAAGTPVLALFGPTDPAVWAPRGPNVRVARWAGHGNLSRRPRRGLQ